MWRRELRPCSDLRQLREWPGIRAPLHRLRQQEQQFGSLLRQVQHPAPLLILPRIPCRGIGNNAIMDSMTKPIMMVELKTFDGKVGRVRALFDTGSYRTLIREDCLPAGAIVVPAMPERELRTAAKGGRLRVTGGVILSVGVNGRFFEGEVLVSPDLNQELLVGAEMMQAWDISVRNHNGSTEVVVGRHLGDPDVQEVD